MICIWVVTTSLMTAAASGGTGYEYRAPSANAAGAHSTQASAGAGYGYQTGAHYLGPYSGYATGSYVHSGSAFGVDSNKKYLSGSGSESAYHQTSTGSIAGSGGAYNVFGSGSSHNAGSSSSGSGLGTGSNNYYGSAGSSGYNNYYDSSGSTSGSNYNTVGTGSGHQLTEYQTTFESTADTSGLDKIGGYYESANLYSSGAKQEYYLQDSRQPTKVFKHFYVISAPEEPEPVRRQPIILPPPQKHYKVIFIKAPSQPAPAPQIITVPQQNEEKTIIYVLVKKPEDIKNIDLPKFDSKLPTKPEVFFIKYNDKSDSQALIDNIVKDYNKGGIKASFSDLKLGNSGAGSSSSINVEPSGSLDGILGSSQSSRSEVSDTSNRFGEGYTFLNNIGSSILDTGTGTHLQSSSNSGSGSIDVPSVGTEPSNGFQLMSSYVSSSTPAVETYDNIFNTENFASDNNNNVIQNVVNTFASVIPNSNSAAGANQDYNSYYTQAQKPSVSFGTNYGTASVGTGSGEPPLIAPSSDSIGSPTATNSPAASGSSYGSSIVSTSQGVPHESYGPPTFKVL